MEITARDILEAFVENDLQPVWGTYGDGIEKGCALTAYTLSTAGRHASYCTPDRTTLMERIERDNYNLLIAGYEDSMRGDRPLVKGPESENPFYRAGLEAGKRLVAADKDPRVALMEMDLESVKAEAALA